MFSVKLPTVVFTVAIGTSASVKYSVANVLVWKTSAEQLLIMLIVRSPENYLYTTDSPFLFVKLVLSMMSFTLDLSICGASKFTID